MTDTPLLIARQRVEEPPSAEDLAVSSLWSAPVWTAAARHAGDLWPRLYPTVHALASTGHNPEHAVLALLLAIHSPVTAPLETRYP